MVFGMAVPSARSTRNPPISSPRTTDWRSEFRGVADRYLEEHHGIAKGECGSPLAPPLLQQVLARVALVRVIGDERTGTSPAASSIRTLGRLVELDRGGAQFGRAERARDERDDDDGRDKKAAILMPSGRSIDVGDCGIGEDQGDRAEGPGQPALSGTRAASVTATAAELISTSTPVA